jgi:hypothetical protein
MDELNDTTDYSQGKIYKIVCNKTGLIYIGSTIKTLDERLKRHEYDCRRFIDNYKIRPDKKTRFCSSFFILLNKDYKIELIENYPCKSRIELEIKECEYMKLYPDSVNYARRPIGSTLEVYSPIKCNYNEQLKNIKRLLNLD